MFSITIAVGNVSWRLLYKEVGNAEKNLLLLQNMVGSLSTPPLSINDDFGQTCLIDASSFHGLLFEDLEKTKLAQIEMALYQARAQAAANKAAQADPSLRANAMMSSPGVLSPMNSFRPS